MMRKITPTVVSTALAAVLIFPFSSAHATIHYPHGFYLGLGVAGAQMTPSTLECDSGLCTTTNGSTAIDLESKISPGGVAHIGYTLKTLPLQFELSYQYFYKFSYDDSSIVSTISGIPSSETADVTTQAAFANIILNGNFFHWPIIPFIMGGYGANFSEVDINYTPNDSSVGSGSFIDRELHGAWEAGAGIYYRITNNLFVSLIYKYQNLGELDWNINDNSGLTSNNLTNNQGEVALIYYIGDQHQPPSLINTD